MRQTLTPGDDRSGSITTASVAQTVAASNSARIAMSFQNTSDTEMRLAEDGNDASPTNGFKLAAGDLVAISTTRRISVYCTVAGKTFESTEN